MLRTLCGLVFGVLLAACLCGPSRAAGETPAIPDTPAGRQLDAWLKAYNSAAADARRRFIIDQFTAAALKSRPLEERMEGFEELHHNNRKLELSKVVRAGAHEIEALARSPLTESWVRIRLEVEKDVPHRICEDRIQSTDPPPEALPRGTLTDTEIARQVEAYVDKLVDADLFSGAVCIARDGKPFFTKASGLASRAYNVPNRLDTKFNLGSMNKMFTAIAVAQLAQQGKLGFDDPLIKPLPDYPNKDVARKITIHQLLTHTSGLGNIFGEKFMAAAKDRFRTNEDFFPLFVDKPLTGEPGREFRYSNAGFIVLGAVVEKVSGAKYDDYVRTYVYKPAGMVHTDAYELDRDTPNLAIGYTGDAAEGLRNNLLMLFVKGGPAGGGYSTVEDLTRFAVALNRGKLLDKKHADVVLTGKVPTGRRPSERYAYGFFERSLPGARIVGHGGGFAGVDSQLDIYLDRDYTVAVMSNYDPPAGRRIAEKARALITQK